MRSVVVVVVVVVVLGLGLGAAAALGGTVTASAAPPFRPDPAASSDPAWAHAVAAWRLADAQGTPRTATASWEAVAAELDAIATADAAVAATLAWERAIHGTPHAAAIRPEGAPEPLDAHEQHLVDAAARFFTLAGAGTSDARAVQVRFARGHVRWSRGQLADAEADFSELVTNHPAADVAPAAAEMLLDALNREQRYPELLRWASVMLASDALVRQDAELAATLHKLVLQSERHDAELAEQRGEYEPCLAFYDHAYALEPRAPGADEVLYNAGVCAEEARAPAVAIARWRELIRIGPGSRLAGKARMRIARLESDVFDLPAAAADLEAFARGYPGEKEAVDALDDALALRDVLGDPAAIDRDLALIPLFHGLPPKRWAARVFQIARHRLATGDRAGARRALDQALAFRGDPEPALPQLAFELACPVAVTDELCLVRGVPAVRDPRLAGLALAAARATPADARHRRVLALAAVEVALQTRDFDKRAAALAALRAARDPADPETELVQLAAEARIARHDGDVPTSRALLEICRDHALIAFRPTWVTSCSAARGDPPEPRELRPAPRSNPVAPDPE